MTVKAKQSAEEYVFGLAMYMLTSARGLVDEPRMYGPLRLVESISRLVELPEFASCIKRDSFLGAMKRKIDQNKFEVMASEERFVNFLDELIREFAAELKRREGIE